MAAWAPARHAWHPCLDSRQRRHILNYMVKLNPLALDRTFAALADPTRRALLARLAAEPDLSVSALARPFAVSLPAIMKHLDVLSDAGLVARNKSGRTVTCRLTPAPMQAAVDWLNRYERFWSESLRVDFALRSSRCCSLSSPGTSRDPSSRSSAAQRAACSSGRSRYPMPTSWRASGTKFGNRDIPEMGAAA